MISRAAGLKKTSGGADPDRSSPNAGERKSIRMSILVSFFIPIKALLPEFGVIIRAGEAVSLRYSP